MIPFGVKDSNNYYWWNLGGWGNTQTAIEKAVAGQKTIVAAEQPCALRPVSGMT